MLDLARQNRKNPTEAEAIMWQALRNHFYGFRFRRQHAIYGYIADFVCLPKKLIIEIDGGYHLVEEQVQRDELRTVDLNCLGYTVMRFTNEEVVFDIDNVLNKIKLYLIKEQI